MFSLDPRDGRSPRIQNVHSGRQARRNDQESVRRDFEPVRGAFECLEDDAFVGQVGVPPVRGGAGIVNVIGVDVAFVGGDEVDFDGVVVEISLPAGGDFAHAFEAAVGDVEGFAVRGKGYAVGVVEGVFHYGHFAG